VIVGRTEKAAAPGDFFTFDLAGESILVVNDGGTRRAFHNVCRHRGRRLVDAECGRAQALACPFHAWTYGLDGALRGVPCLAAFGDGFRKEEHGLAPVRAAEWGGLVFVNLDGRAEPLADWLAPLPECIDGWYRPDRLKKEGSVEIRGNWKLILDNFLEFYHLAGLHRQRVGRILPEESAFALFRRHAIQAIPLAARRGWPGVRTAEWRDWLVAERHREVGISYHLSLFPNVSVHVNPHVGTVGFVQGMPHPTDPMRSSMNVWKFMLDESPPEPWIEEQVQQDIDNMEPHSSGLRSVSFARQTLSAYECRVAHFHALIDAHLAER
jgi:phenylpropionate dioxygenase-like ring-hydroxylating dioxygenase large terminal subunit